MSTKKPKLIFQIVLGIFLLSFASCNNSSESKESTDSTTKKTDSTTMPKMDTTNKMDTAKTRPVAPGN